MVEPVERRQARLAASVGALVESAAEQVDSADRRTELAADRTVLAALVRIWTAKR